MDPAWRTHSGRPRAAPCRARRASSPRWNRKRCGRRASPTSVRWRLEPKSRRTRLRTTSSTRRSAPSSSSSRPAGACELAAVLDAAMSIMGYTIGNDVSSRTIEGENPLYLPQAKVYDGSCALGPCIVPANEAEPPFAISLEVARGNDHAYRGSTSTELMKRTFEELASYLGRALSFPAGAVLLTGTALVPDAPFTLEHGDVVRIGIDGLGLLENAVTTVGAGHSASSARTAPA